MTNEERAAEIVYATGRSQELSLAVVSRLKAAGLLTPDPEPKYRWITEEDRSGFAARGAFVFYETHFTTPAERACVLAALNAMEAE